MLKNSLDYRLIINSNSVNYEYLKEKVYDEIRNEISDILDFIRCYEEEDYIIVYEMCEVAEIWIDATAGTEYKKHSEAVIMARQLVRTLVNSMFYNRSFEISSSAKTSIIVKNIIAYLSSFSEEVK